MVTRTGIAQAYARTQRTLRSPEHIFQVRHMPWTIQPFLLAPVLPGETMEHLLMQSRVVSDPIKHPLIGWWCEYYFFYVKLRDLDDRDALTDLMVNPEGNLNALRTAANVKYSHAANGINFTQKALKRVVEEYFRNEGEAWDAFLIDGMPIASIGRESYLNSAMGNSDYLVPDVSLTVGADDIIKGSEIEATMRQWQMLREHNLVAMDYDDWLRSFGVPVQQAETHKPELMRYVREWTYPTNTVDPVSGAPSSAVSWAVRDRIDKRFAFLEPGFVLGVTVARPKVYLRNSVGQAAHFMETALRWLPAMMHDDAGASLALFADGAGPLPGNADATGYWIDMRDLFVYGDQFLNFDLAATDAGLVALPQANLQRRYVAKADVDGLFKGAADANRLVRQDGIVQMSVRGRQRDRTPLVPAA